MRLISIILLIYSIIFISCSDDDTININNKGILALKVVDKNGNPINKKAHIIIYSSIDQYSGMIVDDSTDFTGNFQGKFLEGDYTSYCYYPDGLVEYRDYKSFQILGSETKNVVLMPLSNVGTVQVKVLSKKDSSAYKGINVSIIARNRSSSSSINYEFNEVMTKVYRTGSTDDNGIIYFYELPASFSFSILIYYDANRWDYPKNTNFSVAKRDDGGFESIIVFTSI